MGLADLLKEADRQFTICNACRYCEAYCAVFPAMELRTEFAKKDVLHLANLCHDCRGCFYACMYAPPHEFAVNIPEVLASVRLETYREHGWPRSLSRRLATGGLLSAVILTVLGIVATLGLIFAFGEPHNLLVAQSGPGSFFRILPYYAMVAPFLIVSFYVVAAMIGGGISYWRATRGSLRELFDGRALLGAAQDALSLRYLNDTEDGCYYPSEDPSRSRPIFHHLIFYGFMADFVSTSAAALMHNVLQVHPPYPLWSVPVVTGTLGGIGQIVGTVGLIRLKWGSDLRPALRKMISQDYALLATLNLVSVTGMFTLLVRETPLLGPALTIHLGSLFGFYVAMPYGKFVHFVYRYAALIQHRIESRADMPARTH